MAIRVNLQELNLPDFFNEKTESLINQVIEDIRHLESGQPTTRFNVRPLPSEIETESFPDHRIYYTYVPCNTTYVEWGTCILEIHFKDANNYHVYVVA
jgi:hypothetical protein